ncbi:hypothetical protein M3197_13020 [Sporosarcina aquimarina]|nr:hypothetical protein [Sporosarcina aquimarina]
MYRKNPGQQVGWKAFLVLLFGISSFSITWTMANTIIRIAVLPLGVWVLYFVLKRKEGRWERYRKFAWLGFGANYIFLLSILVASSIGHFVYPSNHVATFVSDVKEASILSIHPTGNAKVSLNVKALNSELQTLKQSQIFDESWYEDTFYQEKARYERFPYLLMDVKPKWGSGVRSTIYVEEDGKGLLIQTPTEYLYFRSTQSFVKGSDAR